MSDERRDLYDLVSWAVARRPKESLVTASQRIMAKPRGSLAWRVAAILLSPRTNEEPWANMRRAGKAARRIQRGLRR